MHRRDLLNLLSLSTLAGVAGCERPSISSRLAAASMQAIPGSGFVPDVELVLTAAPDEVSVLPGVPRGCGALLAACAKASRHSTGSRRFVPRTSHPAAPPSEGAHPLREPTQRRLDCHWHGLDVPESADGHPNLVIAHGHEYVYDFEVTNRAGTY